MHLVSYYPGLVWLQPTSLRRGVLLDAPIAHIYATL